jgi:hypothetical protein
MTLVDSNILLDLVTDDPTWVSGLPMRCREPPMNRPWPSIR